MGMEKEHRKQINIGFAREYFSLQAKAKFEVAKALYEKRQKRPSTYGQFIEFLVDFWLKNGAGFSEDEIRAINEKFK